MRYGVISTYEERVVSSRTADVQNQCYILANQISKDDFLAEQNSEAIEEKILQLADIYSGRILVVDNRFKIVRDSFALDEGKTLVSPEAVRAMDGKSSVADNRKEGFLEVAVPIADADGRNSAGAIIASVSTASIEDSLDHMRSRSMLIFLGILVVVSLGAVLFTLAINLPIRRARDAARSIAGGYAESTGDPKTYSEIREIINSFDEVMARIKTMDDSRNEFVSNVAHELKTPIASMKVLADSILTQEEVPNEIYHEFLQDIAQEIDRESNIINDLLALVRLENKASMDISSVNINELLEYILKRLRPIAQQRDIELVLESFRPVIAEVDETKLSQALTNLIENAVKYNVENGWVHVSLNADHQYFYIRVEDSGIGIPEEDQEQVFERFYRVDKSRSKEISGTGLGLAITKNVILLHRGAVKLYSKEDEGTTFQIRIPLLFVK